MFKATLVLEGGAARGVFTAGVLDFLMEKNVYFSHVIGVSAGACNAADYVSRQPYRTKKCMIPENADWSYWNDFEKTLKEKSLLDMNFLFDRLPNELLPFDYETFFHSETICEFVVTNCLTGKAEYLQEKQDKERFTKICRASASVPLLTPIVYIDGFPYFDGGIADSVPLKHALEAENDRIVLILTRMQGYRKENVKNGYADLYRKAYESYPAALKSMMTASIFYNRTMNLVDKLEEEGKIFVIRPLRKPVSRFERDKEALQKFYKHGYELMGEEYERLLHYMNG